MNCIIQLANSGKYAGIVYAASYLNPLCDVAEVEKGLQEMNIQPGVVLFDLLLTNGDNFNRFAEVVYDGTKLHLQNAKVVKLDTPFRKRIDNFYKGKAKLVSGGVLSPSQRFNFAKGQ